MFYRTSFHSSKPNFVLTKEYTLTCIHTLKSGTNLFSKSLNNRKKQLSCLRFLYHYNSITKNMSIFLFKIMAILFWFLNRRMHKVPMHSHSYKMSCEQSERSCILYLCHYNPWLVYFLLQFILQSAQYYRQFMY